ncbi:Venom dipeptidyl peptidase 4 [Eumeta japonica]|uniref:Venom dipeptidyl peptidase 4 n=1 Tax=Eumeta variegata TaxID=151549 RepID=A0A4C2A1V4_EUMVA|nr:Venom dipeptidyl peptidase 4 [Eumeta japonica]
MINASCTFKEAESGDQERHTVCRHSGRQGPQLGNAIPISPHFTRLISKHKTTRLNGGSQGRIAQFTYIFTHATTDVLECRTANANHSDYSRVVAMNGERVEHVMKKVGRLVEPLQQLCYAYGTQLGTTEIIYRKKTLKPNPEEVLKLEDTEENINRSAEKKKEGLEDNPDSLLCSNFDDFFTDEEDAVLVDCENTFQPAKLAVEVLCRRDTDLVWSFLWCALWLAAVTAQDRFSLEEWLRGDFSQRGFGGTWISGDVEIFTLMGCHFKFAPGDTQTSYATGYGYILRNTEFTYTIPNEPGIYMFDASTLTTTVLVAGELMVGYSKDKLTQKQCIDQLTSTFGDEAPSKTTAYHWSSWFQDFLNTDSPILSADRQFILAPSERRSVYRYSTTARYSLYQISTGTVTEIAGGQRLQLCIFGGGHSLAYVLDNNLYYLPGGAAQPFQITTDGIPDEIYNGHTDWVYEEDVMYTGQATWFSTQGTYLAFASFDDTLVKSYSYYYYVDKSDPDDLYPELIDLKYPKVGDVNPLVTLRILNLNTLTATGNMQLVTVPAPAEVGVDHILGGVRWLTDNELAVHWLNRRQNYLILRICNVETWVCEEELREQGNGWVPVYLPSFSTDGSFFMSLRWSPEPIEGIIWQHLYMSVRENGIITSRSITPGAFTVDNFVGMHENNPSYYYTATVPNTPWRRHVYSTGLRDECISCDIRLPQGGECSWASATLSLGGSYMTITCSSPTEPSATYIFDPFNRVNLYEWENNNIVRERLQNKTIPRSIITTVPLEDGFPAPVRIHLPPELDLDDPNTTYPMMFYVYSGPNTNTVYDTFTVGYHSYLTTNKSMIYMMADGRGSGLKGQEILYSLNNALGTVEIEDHLVILRQVLDRYPWIDRTRVGMWGHSYGGYATLLTLIIDDDDMIRCGVSGAPVTSWLYYNTMYTERYMGLPTPEDNLSGYERGDVTLLVEKLDGKDFYIMHGNADDNVHYQNAAKLMRALQERNIPFEQMWRRDRCVGCAECLGKTDVETVMLTSGLKEVVVTRVLCHLERVNERRLIKQIYRANSYPDEAHSLAAVNMHRYMTMDHYWARCLDLH